MSLEKCLVTGISIMIIVVLMGRHRDFFEFKNNQNYSKRRKGHCGLISIFIHAALAYPE